MEYTSLGGSDTWTNMLKTSHLSSPFEGDTLKEICKKVQEYLDNYDLTDIA